MTRLTPGLLAATAALALSLSALQPAQANPSDRTPDEVDGVARVRPDDRHGLHARQQRRDRQKALELVDAGKAQLEAQPGGGATVQLSDGTYVEFPVGKSDRIFTILSQFGTSGSGRYGTVPGPLHNQIPEPNRTRDNSTYWLSDFNQAHYDDMFNGSGESFANYYKQLSSGRYTATNTVEDWVTVPGNASSYGDNAIEDRGGAWQFIADTGNSWYQAQVAAGRTPAEIDAYLAQFDVWDRYDFDGDGDFNEPDGYIDHFQAVHAGVGEEAGGGAQGADAIWSHRWYAYPTAAGTTGPTVGDTTDLNGGTRIGGSSYFIGDYTVEPENGGLGVFAHEFGHDLGLPDFYDTAGGENGTAFWTLMSSGSWLGHGGDSIGTTPGLMGPEEKRSLGWLDYTEVNAGQDGSYTLGPAAHTYDGADQALKVNLPDSEVPNTYTTPPSGSYAWYSGRGDNLTTTLTRPVPAASRVTVQASAWYQIEQGYDYLYAEYSLDGGQTWARAGAPVDGFSRGWTSKRWAYSANGKPSLFRFRYATDGGVNEAGVFLDDISIGAGTAYSFTDDAEANNGWTADGWKLSTGNETRPTKRFYLLENRQYVGYDTTLEHGPYQFSEAVTRPDWVEHFPFQDGMLVWLVDEAYADNNASAHHGHGYALPVDVRPDSLTYPDGTSPSNRREPFDATFSLDATDGVCLDKQVPGHRPGSYTTLTACAPSVAGIATFDDSIADAYWDSANPQNSTLVAGVGVTATITANDAGFLTVAVHNPAR